MIDYYAKVAPAMIPHLSGRAVTLRRFPEGVEDFDAAFFEKRCPKHRPKWVKTARVEAGPRAGKIDFCVCDGLPTLVWMAQLAAVEFHPSLSKARAPKRPTVLAFDLDPGPPADIVDCCRVALRLRDIFGHFGVQCFPKTSGSKGMQVYVPLNNKKVNYEKTKPFAKAIAQLLEKQTPDKVVSKMKKVEREGKVFVDWSQNHQRKTTIAVYSLRARERQTASTPITWDEVEAAADSGDELEARLRVRRGARPDREARRPLRPGAGARTGAAGPLGGVLRVLSEPVPARSSSHALDGWGSIYLGKKRVDGLLPRHKVSISTKKLEPISIVDSIICISISEHFDRYLF